MGSSSSSFGSCKPCAENAPSALKEHAAILQKTRAASGTVAANPILFPMYVVRLEDFMKMKDIRAQQVLLQEGILTEFKEGMGKVIFVSHQWVAHLFPDPDFAQLRVLQEALTNVMSGSITISVDFPSQVLHGISKATSAADLAAQPLFLWYDYFSCPQMAARTEGQDVGKDLTNAVESIPGYVERSDFFVITAPVLKHADRDDMLSYNSWKTRGWCRAERAARALAAGDHQGSMIVVTSPTQVEMCSPGESMQAPVGLGDFTVMADVERVTPFMRALIKNKLQFALETGDLRTYRVMLNVQHVFCKNLDIQHIEILPCIEDLITYPVAAIPDESPEIGSQAEPSDVVDTFLHQNGFLNVSDPDEYGWAPLHYAVLRDDPLLVRGLLARRADIHAVAKAPERLLNSNPKSSVLHLSSCTSSINAMKELVANKADVDAADGNGFAPMHCCGVANNVEGIKLLLESGANRLHRNKLGATPIIGAAVWGQNDAIKAFLEAGIPFSAAPGSFSALQAAILNMGTVSVIRTLLDAKADVDEPWRVAATNPVGLFLTVKGLAYQCGSTNLTAQVGYHIFGATPLILCAMLSKFDIADVLLEAGAKVDLRNDRGMTAAEIAKEMSGPATFLKKLELNA